MRRRLHGLHSAGWRVGLASLVSRVGPGAVEEFYMLVQRLFASAMLLVCLVLAVMAWPYQAAFSYEPVGPRAYPLLMLALMGVSFLYMAVRPTPVIICSTRADSSTGVTMEALAAGAVSVISKPALGVRDFLHDTFDDLANAIRAAAQAHPARSIAGHAAHGCQGLAPAPEATPAAVSAASVAPAAPLPAEDIPTLFLSNPIRIAARGATLDNAIQASAGSARGRRSLSVAT